MKRKKYSSYVSTHTQIFRTLCEGMSSVYVGFFPLLRVPIPFATAAVLDVCLKLYFPKKRCSVGRHCTGF